MPRNTVSIWAASASAGLNGALGAAAADADVAGGGVSVEVAGFAGSFFGGSAFADAEGAGFGGSEALADAGGSGIADGIADALGAALADAAAIARADATIAPPRRKVGRDPDF